QTVYVAPAPAPAYRPHPYVRHLASVGEGMVIEHQIDDHHH
ncbi:protein YbjH, partial [Escherichia coli]